MGTRALINVYNAVGDKLPLIAIYSQYDGYPDGVGKDLYEILKDITIVNGFSRGMTTDTHANGMGCLALTVAMKLKQSSGVGGYYAETPSETTEDRSYLSFVYHIFPMSHSVQGHTVVGMTVLERGIAAPLYSGPVSEFGAWMLTAAEEAEEPEDEIP